MTDNNSSPRPAERWVGLLIAGVTALAAVGGTVATFIALNRPDQPDSAAAAASSPTAAVVSAMPSPTPSISAAPASVSPSPAAVGLDIPTGAKFLDGMTPESGKESLQKLPPAYQGKPGYEHAIKVACAAPGKKYAEVVYVLGGGFGTFTTTMVGVAYDAGALGERTQVSVYGDPRIVDANTPASPLLGGAQEATGKPARIELAVDDVWALRLKITCTSTTDSVILQSPYVAPR